MFYYIFCIIYDIRRISDRREGIQNMDLQNCNEIYFAGGCFWGVEAYFRRVAGVRDVTAGYANGNTDKPSYEAVCSGRTGFAEAVRVKYGPLEVSLGQGSIILTRLTGRWRRRWPARCKKIFPSPWQWKLCR